MGWSLGRQLVGSLSSRSPMRSLAEVRRLGRELRESIVYQALAQMHI